MTRVFWGRLDLFRTKVLSNLEAASEEVGSNVGSESTAIEVLGAPTERTQLSYEKKPGLTFHYTGWFLGLRDPYIGLLKSPYIG